MSLESSTRDRGLLASLAEAEVWIPLVFFVVLFVHGGTLGITDDEAYYWVLGQRPALGYAYHPPAVAWVISLTQFVFKPLLGWNPVALVRLPAALMAALILAMSLKWLRLAGISGNRLRLGAAVLISFVGFFGGAWMIVPDLPLFVGWTLALLATWRLCFMDAQAEDYVALGFGIALAVLSKYSGVLAAGSVIAALWLWASPGVRKKGWITVCLGLALAALPILIWNAQHSWVSILYQIHDRHSGGSLSLKRWVRFWVAEAVLAGPVLLAYAIMMFQRARRKRGDSRVTRFLLVWALPGALVFCFQPLWADFKPHWAFVVWFPAALELAWGVAQGRDSKWARGQIYYGWSVGIVVLLLCHAPIQSWITDVLFSKQVNPKLDVTNDMYGWSDLRAFLETKPDESILRLPVIGSRYQTSSQAAFALQDASRVALIPRGTREAADWPDLKATDHQGPDWPKLLAPVLYVADIRYDARPEFKDADCAYLGRLEKYRASYLAKWIDVWKCSPSP